MSPNTKNVVQWSVTITSILFSLLSLSLVLIEPNQLSPSAIQR